MITQMAYMLKPKYFMICRSLCSKWHQKMPCHSWDVQYFCAKLYMANEKGLMYIHAKFHSCSYSDTSFIDMGNLLMEWTS